MVVARSTAVVLLLTGLAGCADPGLRVIPPSQTPRMVQPLAPQLRHPRLQDRAP